MSLSDYYVYAHVGNNSGHVFYIGRGRGIRCRVRKQRPDYWQNKVKEEGGYSIQFLAENLTKSDAIEKEDFFLSQDSFADSLINKRKKNDRVLCVDLALVLERLMLDKSSPSGFCWRVKPRGTNRSIGDFAGNLSGKYWQVNLNNKSYLAHRLIYALHFPFVAMEDKVVNHIDCNPSNNKIENLELITQEDNLRRTKVTTGICLSKGNKTGYNGLCCSESTGYPLMIARFNNKNKPYSINKYGKDEATRLCLEWLKEQKNAAK